MKEGLVDEGIGARHKPFMLGGAVAKSPVFSVEGIPGEGLLRGFDARPAPVVSLLRYVITCPASHFPIRTSSLALAGAVGIGFKFCGSRQLSRMPTCCTQETVQRGPQNLSVKYSRWRISGVYCDSGIAG